MTRYRGTYRIESARLAGWDYAQGGLYFITICTQRKRCHFGRVEHAKIRLSGIGHAARTIWFTIPKHRSHVELDAFVVVPNHVHGVLVLTEGIEGVQAKRDVARYVSTEESETLGARRMSTISPKPGSLSSIVRSYKSSVTKWCRANGYNTFAWQPRFYDHIIRNEKSLLEIRTYIENNPAQWELDRENPESPQWRGHASDKPR